MSFTVPLIGAVPDNGKEVLTGLPALPTTFISAVPETGPLAGGFIRKVEVPEKVRGTVMGKITVAEAVADPLKPPL
jgi:hypothetical protein